ncbi:hypothetical protein [Sinorhizobium saheli]|uniref:Uncharacterized protein n=1 Tax=Sinorhizobium saheli TaxID=36856 RepID=A0A178XY84_SINSA|nr:hypothetical protein [Sinorhizobium saheli]MQW90130.1 hypothetical protein [Sinorhizobium saheli]OAP40260.1 hypothetical protein ATB98_02130 [Sinorhizobium saheli]
MFELDFAPCRSAKSVDRRCRGRRLVLDFQGFEDASKAFHGFLKGFAGSRRFAINSPPLALFLSDRLSKRPAAVAPQVLANALFSRRFSAVPG